MDPLLYNINFQSILHAVKEVNINENGKCKYEYNGFCVDCEEKKMIDPDNGVIRKISHGATLSEYESVLGTLPKANDGLKAMFVFQDPNGDDSFSERLQYKGYYKYVPSKKFYWHPSVTSWNVQIEEILENPYGPYIAYLMQRFKFKDVYITNAVKCYYGKSDIKKCAENCIRKYLFIESSIFMPDIVIAFSIDVANMIDYKEIPGKLAQLYHPSFMVYRSQTKKMMPIEIIDVNNRMIEEKIRLTIAST